MKVYSISKAAFWIIFVLIMTLPLSRHWRLFTAGEKAIGTVITYERYASENIFGEKELRWASKVEFPVGDSTVVTHGPDGEEMDIGDQVTVYYNPAHPEKHCLMTFPAIYLTYYTVLPIILLMLWGAFYMSFNHYQKKTGDRSKLPADSPYKQWRPGGGDNGRKKDEQGRLLKHT